MPIPGGASRSADVEFVLIWPYLVLLMPSGSLDYFLRGNLNVLSYDFVNLSSISFLKSISSASIFLLTYLYLVRGPFVNPIMLPEDVLYS